MIEGNVKIVDNLIKKGNLHNGVVSTTISKIVDVSRCNFIEVTILVKTANNSAYFNCLRTTAVTGEADTPMMYYYNGQRVNGDKLSLNKVGVHRVIIDILSHKSVSLLLTTTATSEFADVKVDYALVSLPKPNFMSSSTISIAEKPPLLSIIAKNSTTIGGGPVETRGMKYAVIESSVYSPSAVLSHFYVKLVTPTGYVYPEVRDAVTNEVVSYGNAQVRFNKSGITRYYVDLLKYGATYINILASNTDANCDANVTLTNLTNVLPFEKKEVSSTTPALFEGDKYKFKKIGTFSDAWNGYLANFTAKEVTLTDDPNVPRQKVYDFKDKAPSGVWILEVRIIPFDPAMKNTTVNQRLFVRLNTGELFVNYYNGGGENDWGTPHFWEHRGTNRKVRVKTQGEVTQPYHRFDPTLSDDRYSRNKVKNYDGVNFIEFQEPPFAINLGAWCRTKKMVVIGTYGQGGERPCVWMTTDGGENWVLQYDFINSYTLLSNDVNTSAFSAYTGGLTLKKVNPQFPSADNKEPTILFTYTDVSMTDITTGAKTIINATAHGLKNGDIVILTGTGQDANWNALKCDEFTDVYFKQNAYSVAVINANSFYLKEYLGSYDRPLMCRHIHSVNEVVGGCVVATGEEYPNGWFLYLDQKYKDASTVVDAFKRVKSNVYRLNSSKEGIQRACGIVFDNMPDPTILFNCDTSNPNFGGWTIDGRTSLPVKPTNGLWRGKMSDIDDWSKFECILPIPEPAIWMFQQGQVIVAYYQLGGNAVSVDGGKTWDYFPKGTSQINGVFDNRIVIGGGYIFEWK